MKKYYCILLSICMIGMILLLLENKFVNPYTPLAELLIQKNGEEESTTEQIKIQFDYIKQDVLGSNQIAIWIEDSEGNLVKTLAVTQYTSTGGWRLRKTSLPTWAQISTPESMRREEIDAVSSPTPRENKTYSVLWDFTDANDHAVTEGTYNCFLEGTLYFTDRVLYSWEIQVGEKVMVIQQDPIYTNEKSRHKNMLSHVNVSYQKGKEGNDES